MILIVLIWRQNFVLYVSRCYFIENVAYNLDEKYPLVIYFHWKKSNNTEKLINLVTYLYTCRSNGVVRAVNGS